MRATPKSRNTFRLCQKMGDGTPRRLCMSHSHFNAANFCGDGTAHFRFSNTQTWKSIWNTQNYFMELLARYLSLLWQLNCFWKVSIVLYFQVKLPFTLRDIFRLLLRTSLPFYEFVEKIDWQMVKYKP